MLLKSIYGNIDVKNIFQTSIEIDFHIYNYSYHRHEMVYID